LDTVVLTNEVLNKMKEDMKREETREQPGVLVYGLFLEGAAWSRTNSRLIESKNKILYDSMPVMHLSATSGTESLLMSAKTLNYVCPIYKKPKRTDLTYITSVNLRTTGNTDTWTLRGTCLLCDIK
jgi:dynein heavy chain, axonemal